MGETVCVDFTGMLKAAGAPRSVAAGEPVFSQGEPGDCMYAVLSGQVEIRVGGKYLDTVGPGNIIGEMAMLDDSPRSATVVALEDCELACVDQERFLKLISATPVFAISVMRVMADRLRGMNQLV